MWAEIKKAINDSLGRKRFKPLDEIVKEQTYERFYDYISIQGSSNVGIVDRSIIDYVNLGDIDSIFVNDTTIEKVVFPWGIFATSRNCCDSATNLSYVVMPDTVDEISENSFRNCSKITFVKLSDNLKTIKANAFNGTGLLYIKLPESVEEIALTAFENCTELTVIDAGFAEGKVEGAPWGARKATIYYDQV